MTATVGDREHVPVFFDFEKAKEEGLLSRSDWRSRGRRVIKGSIADGIVVTKKGLVHKCMVKSRIVVPVLGEQEDCLIIADKWAEVFCQEHTAVISKRKQSGCTVTPATVLQDEEEGGGNGSLMTQKASEVIAASCFTSCGDKTGIPSVNSVRAYIPEGLLLPDTCPVKEQIWWFCGLLYWKHLEGRLPWHDPIPLKYDYLKDNIPCWPQVWEWCERLGLVERTPGYTPGEHSYGYWTALPYREQIHRLLTFEHKGLAKRLRAIERKYLCRPIMAHLRKQLERLSVDMEDFRRRFSAHPNRHYYRAHLQTILDGELRLTADDFSGRLHSNVSNMFKPLRALLRVDSEPDTLGETDIKNSQPLFLGVAARDQGVDDHRYMRLCEEGQLYEHMAKRLGVLRESAKHEVMVFLFAKNGFRSKAKSVFEREFPSLAAFIHRMKAKDNRRLSREMQRAERRLVVDTVCDRIKRLRKEMFITTIHDAVLARKQDCDLIVAEMREAFAQKGVAPCLRWEDVGRHLPAEDAERPRDQFQWPVEAHRSA